MSEVSCSSITAPGLNREILTKSFRSSYNFISENAYVKPDLDNKDISHLKKTVNCLEQNISFMQHEHGQMLEGLQKQIEKLREENQDLQFQLIVRTDRVKDHDNSTVTKSPDTDFTKSKLLSDQILFLKRALDEEKRKNKALHDQLELLKDKIPSSLENDIEERSELAMSNDEIIFISPDIRVSLNPLVVSTYHHDSGVYLTKSPLTIQDCEMVIQTLLKKMDSSSDTSDRSVLTRSFNSNPSLKCAPGIKKPLQPIKPISRGSTIMKVNQLNGTQCSNPIRMPSSQKLIPIITQKHDINKLEHNSQNSSRTGRDSKLQETLPTFAETKTGSSLPALPKPNDYNQADRQRRLHILQRKRLDQYNNRS